MKQYLNGQLVDVPEQQETKIKEQAKLDIAEKEKRAKEKETTIANKSSAISKLKTLGLSEDEISALVGE
tara:strand:+ start:963 stop:1169 length:207 start_codon:yes stop_codon:yes gene_type:complete